MSVNRVIVVGNMGKQVFSGGSPDNPIANFSVATSESWKDKATGEKKELTEWHRVVAFGRDAKFVSSYAEGGGRLVHVEGRLKTRKFSPKDGGPEKSLTEIVVESFQFLDRPARDGSKAAPLDRAHAPQPAAPQAQSPAQAPAQTAALDDDIPF